MPKISFVAGGQIPPFVAMDEFRHSEVYDAEFNDDPSGAEMRVYFPGTPDELQLFEIRLDADHPIDAHAHDKDEIIYVVAGSLRFGAIECGPGSAICIPRLTLYSFRTGADGAQFLNFRPGGGFGRISKSELRALAT